MRSTNTQIGYVEFTKKDGTTRTMHFTTRWRKEIFKDGQMPYIAEKHGITVVRDINLPVDMCLRSIRWDSVTYLCVRNVIIEWNEDNDAPTFLAEPRTA